jgi:UDP-D-galactose:(glucosyl)LPS alpha-1,6-D-galactosyltransferase
MGVEKMTLDILIPVAEKGGVENVINMVLPYMEDNGWNVRIVQLVWEGYLWTENKNFYPLLKGRDGHTLEEFVDVYKSFVEKNGTPDITLATAWPYASYVAKKVSVQMETAWKVVSWLHSPLERYEAAGYGGYAYLAMADMHFAISRQIADGIRNNLPGSSVIEVHNPVKFPKCAAIHQRNSETYLENDESTDTNERNTPDVRKHTLLFVGRISEEKRLDIIIRALAKANDTWELRIVGTGGEGYTDKLCELARQEGVYNNIKWLGWKENPWDFAENVDALVMASDYEGFPLTAIEALAHGIPVIATPVSGIVELIKPGVNGYLFPNGDDSALAKILQAISKGILPKINATECVNTIQIYDIDNSLGDFECKLREITIHPEFILKNKNWGQLYCNDKISVIIPCYNEELYISECIDSLLASTLPLSMLEFIFVDDASTDGTCQIIRSYEQHFPENILLVECEKNGGLGAARNIGLQYASGNYIGFVDSDDKVDSEMFRKLYEKIVLYQCDMSECGYNTFPTANQNISNFVPEEQYFLFNEPNEKKQYIIRSGCMNSAWLKLYRRSFLEDNDIKFPENTYMEDVYFSQMCMMQAQNCYVIGEPLYWYRQNPNGIMLSDRISKYFMDTFYMQEKACQELEEMGLLRGYEDEYCLLYYVKAFCEPVQRMYTGEHNIKVDSEKIEIIRKAIFNHFPDILSNRYILSDQSELNQKLLNILCGNDENAT